HGFVSGVSVSVSRCINVCLSLSVLLLSLSLSHFRGSQEIKPRLTGLADDVEAIKDLLKREKKKPSGHTVIIKNALGFCETSDTLLKKMIKVGIVVFF